MLSSKESGCCSKDSGSLRSSVPPTDEMALHSHLSLDELTMPSFGVDLVRAGPLDTTE